MDEQHKQEIIRLRRIEAANGRNWSRRQKLSWSRGAPRRNWTVCGSVSAAWLPFGSPRGRDSDPRFANERNSLQIPAGRKKIPCLRRPRRPPGARTIAQAFNIMRLFGRHLPEPAAVSEKLPAQFPAAGNFLDPGRLGPHPLLRRGRERGHLGSPFCWPYPDPCGRRARPSMLKLRRPFWRARLVR